MKRVPCCHFLALLMLAGCGKAPVGSQAVGPVVLSKPAAEKIIKELEQDRAETREWLRSSPSSYLAAVNRVDFGRKTALTVGRAADNDVSLSADDFKPHHLRVTVEGDRFQVEAVDAEASFLIDNQPRRTATVGPSTIQIGRFRLRLSHQGFPAIIVFDPQSPRMREYKGLRYFPIDLAYRYEVALQQDPRKEKFTILSTRGNQRSAERVGWFHCLLGSTPFTLEVTRLLEPGAGEDEVSVFFRDATNGKWTYPLGRYVDAKKLPSGNYLLDFNTAYNPACAISDYYNCPVPPKSNHLKVEIRAGEMDSHYH